MYVVLEAMEKNTIYLIIGCQTGKNKKFFGIQQRWWWDNPKTAYCGKKGQ